ncbi:hypothetical protein HDV00_005815 [Rhizophlyctis rosea]|nr:hypothetical protein HDV00_005815 [Rhizophlyctis rosea]
MTPTPEDRWDSREWQATSDRPGKINAPKAGWIKDVNQFDPFEFGVSSKEANAADPSLLRTIEVAHQTLRDSGIDYRGSNTGVYVGQLLTSIDEVVTDRFDVEGANGTGKCIAIRANRVSFTFDLRGPSLLVDTACSSSGTAMHLALAAIASGEIDQALVLGASTMINPLNSVAFSKLGVLSPTGSSKSFCSLADGYARSEGFGGVLLKRLDKAMEHKDNIYAAITGSCINANGKGKALTMPEGERQALAIAAAYKKAGRDPSEACFVELHATGTVVGDPIEVNAAGKLFAQGRPKTKTLRVGSVKGNMGHMEGCSFLASLLKVAMMFRNKELIPNIRMAQANPKIKFDLFNMMVQTELENMTPEMASVDGHWVGSVSSYGVGGSNAHVVLETIETVVDTLALSVPRPIASSTQNASLYLFPIGSLTDRSNKKLATTLKEAFENTTDDATLRSIARSLARQSRSSPYRSFTVAPSLSATAKFSPTTLVHHKATSHKAVLVFAGQGPQHIAMGRQLAAVYPQFLESVMESDRILQEVYNFPSFVEQSGLFVPGRESTLPSNGVWPVQSVVFSLVFFQVAVCDLLKSLGVEYDVVVGHSIGEVAMGYASGAFSREATIGVAVARALAMATAEGNGSMVALGVKQSKAKSFIQAVLKEEGVTQGLWIAGVNSPSAVTVAGLEPLIDAMVLYAKRNNAFAAKLRVTCAFHSPLMKEQEQLFKETVAPAFTTQPAEPTVQIMSTVEGGWMTRPFNQDYLWDNIRHAVLFKPAIEKVVKDFGSENVTFIEISPHPVLKSYIENCNGNVVTLVKRPNPKFPAQNTGEHHQFLEGIGSLIGFGFNQIDFDKFYGFGSGPEAPIPVTLPLYPYNKTLCWQEDPKQTSLRLDAPRKPLEMPHFRLNAETHPSLTGHVIMGSMLLPASGYVESILEHGAMVIRDVKIAKPLVMADKETSPAHVGLEVKDSNWAFRSSSNASYTAGELRMDVTYANGTFSKNNTAIDESGIRPPRVDIQAMIKTAEQMITGDQFYESIPSSYKYTDYFRIFLKEVYQIPDKLSFCNTAYMSKLVIPDGIFDNVESGYVIHPGLLDEITQIGLAMYINMENNTLEEDVLCLPTSIENFTRWEGTAGNPMRLTSELYSLFRTTEYSPSGPVTGDYFIYNNEGDIIFTIEGFSISLVPSGDVVPIRDANVMERLTTTWQPRSLNIGSVLTNTLLPKTSENVAGLFKNILTGVQGVGRKTLSVLDSTPNPATVRVVDSILSSFLNVESGRLQTEYFCAGPTAAEADAKTAFLSYPHGRSLVIEEGKERETRQRFDVVIASDKSKESVNLVSPGGIFIVVDEIQDAVLVQSIEDVDFTQVVVATDENVIIHHHERGAEGRMVELAKEFNENRKGELWILANDDAAGVAALGAALCIAEESHDFTAYSVLFGDHTLSTTEREQWVHRLRSRQDLLEQHSKITKEGQVYQRRLVMTKQSVREPAKGSTVGLVSKKDKYAMNVSFPAKLTASSVEVNVEAVAFFHEKLLPQTPLVGFVGHVTKSGVSEQRVAGISAHRIATSIVAHQAAIVDIPPNVDADTLAGLALPFFTAHTSLKRASGKVLVLGASTEVGWTTVQLAQRFGLAVKAAVRTPADKEAMVKDLGVVPDDVFLTTHDSEGLRRLSKIPQISNFDLVINSGTAFDTTLPKTLLKQSGRFIHFAPTAGSVSQVVPKQGTVHLMDIKSLVAEAPETVSDALSTLISLHTANPFKLRTSSVEFPTLPATLDSATKDLGLLSVRNLAVIASTRTDPEVQLFDPRKSYVMVGGCSELGVRIAYWMYGLGARHVLMTSRRGFRALGKVDKMYVQHMRDNGVTIDIVAADATSVSDTKSMISRAREYGPIGGIFMMAVVLRDALFTNLTQSSFDDVHKSKVEVLDTVLQFVDPATIDFMLLFSTIGSVFGNAGQAAYCASQLYLDRIAEELPNVMSMSFPPITDSGIFKRLIVASKGRVTAHLTKMGMNTKQVCSFIGDCLIRKIPHYVPIMPGACQYVPDSFRGCEPKLYSHLLKTSLLTGGGDADGDSEAATPASILAPMLGLNPADLTENAPLTSFGLDSMAASQLSHTLKTKLNIVVSQIQLLGTISLADLNRMAAASTDETTEDVVAQAVAQDPLTIKFGEPVQANLDKYLEENETYTTKASVHQQRIWVAQQTNDQRKKNAGVLRIDPRLNKFGSTQWPTHEGYFVELDSDDQYDFESMGRALTIIMQRHAALRTTFSWDEEQGQLMQTVHKTANLTWDYRDFSSFNNVEYAAGYALLEANAANENPGFVLTQLPLIQICLYKCGGKRWAISLIAHHILIDFTSAGLLFHEWLTIQSVGPKYLPPVKLQYTDFSDWQERTQERRQELYADQLEFWMDKLKGIPPLSLSFGESNNTPAKTSQLEMALEPELVKAYNNFCKDNGVTIFVGYMSAYCLALQKYSQSETPFVIGTPVTERETPDLQRTFGFFSNMVSIPIKIDTAQAFLDFMMEFKLNFLECIENRDVPYEDVIAATKASADSRGSRHLFILENAAIPDVGKSFSRMIVKKIPNHDDTPEVLLTVCPDDHVMFMRFNRFLFTENIARDFMQLYKNILTSIIERPNSSIARVTELRSEQYDRVVTKFSGVEETVAFEEQLVHKLVEQSALENAATPALNFETSSMTYKEMNEQANRVARYIQAAGCKVENGVALCIDRGFEQITTILGIAKAGGAFITLDPEAPTLRLQRMISDCGAKLVITTKARESLFKDVQNFTTIVIDSDEVKSALSNLSVDNLDVTGLTPRNLAYIMFTSGTTGRPKGVQIEHRSISNLVQNADKYGFRKGARVLSSLSYTFDPYVLDIFGALAKGCTLCLGSKELVLGSIGDAVLQMQINVLHLTPSILGTVTVQEYPTLETVVVAGEPLPKKLIETWSPKVKFMNMYGPTEVTVDCVHLHVQSRADTGLIGRPMPNCHVYVLDKYQTPVPIGVEGELYIGGIQVSRGYVGQPELTKASFVVNPFNLSETLYKTGDLVRYRQDGRIEYISRNDSQVKIRGQRIELGEINEGIQECAAVAQSSVLINKNHGNPEIVAYIEFTDEAKDREQDELEGLKHYLYATLPQFMYPSVFVVLPQLPKSTSGKVDRRALEALDISPWRTQTDSEVVKPSNDIEDYIWNLVSESLDVGKDEIGVTQDLFMCGLNSLEAVKMAANISTKFEVRLTLQHIYLGPTIREMSRVTLDMIGKEANQLVAADGNDVSMDLLPIKKTGSKPVCFFIHDVTGMATFFMRLGPYMPNEMYALGDRHLGDPDNYTSIIEMARYYITLIKTIQPEGPYYLAGYSFGGTVCMEMAVMLREMGDKVQHVIVIDTVYLPKAQRKAFATNSFIEQSTEAIVANFKELPQQWTDRLWVEVRKNLTLYVDHESRPYDGAVTLIVPRNRMWFRTGPGKDLAMSMTQNMLAANGMDMNNWDKIIPNLELVESPGRHDTMFAPAHVKGLSNVLRNVLKRAADQPYVSQWTTPGVPCANPITLPTLAKPANSGIKLGASWDEIGSGAANVPELVRPDTPSTTSRSASASGSGSASTRSRSSSYTVSDSERSIVSRLPVIHITNSPAFDEPQFVEYGDDSKYMHPPALSPELFEVVPNGRPKEKEPLSIPASVVSQAVYKVPLDGSPKPVPTATLPAPKKKSRLSFSLFAGLRPRLASSTERAKKNAAQPR